MVNPQTTKKTHVFNGMIQAFKGFIIINAVSIYEFHNHNNYQKKLTNKYIKKLEWE